MCCTLIGLALALLGPIASHARAITERQSTSLVGTNIQLLPLGDSITYGLTDPDLNGYRGPLYAELQAAGVTTLNFLGSVKAGNFADPDNEGHSGYTISQIATSSAAIANLMPNVVLINAGTNDAFQNTESASAAVTLLGNLIDQQFAQYGNNTTVLVAKVIPTTLTAAQTYLNTLNAGIPGLVSSRAAAGKHIAVVDQSVLTTADLTDGVHPTVAGYKKMADTWFSALQSAAAKGWLATAVSSTSTTTMSMLMTTTVATSTTRTSAPTAASSSGGTAAHYSQCGGQEWTGPTTCQAPYTCKVANAYYSQCL